MPTGAQRESPTGLEVQRGTPAAFGGRDTRRPNRRPRRRRRGLGRAGPIRIAGVAARNPFSLSAGITRPETVASSVVRVAYVEAGPDAAMLAASHRNSPFRPGKLE